MTQAKICSKWCRFGWDKLLSKTAIDFIFGAPNRGIPILVPDNCWLEKKIYIAY